MRDYESRTRSPAESETDRLLARIATLEAERNKLLNDIVAQRSANDGLIQLGKNLRRKVEDAEVLLFRVYERDVMTHDGTRDAWEGFHGAAEHIRSSTQDES